jgi:PAS domain S-box-containing protein
MDEQVMNRYWKRIVNTMNDGLILISPDGTIIMVNQAFEQQTGYSADEVIGKPCTMLKCDSCEKTMQSDEKAWCALFARDHEDIKRCRCMIMKKDGTWLPAVKNASVLRDDDNVPLGAVETIMDISELDRLEEKVTHLSRQLTGDESFQGIIGKAPNMQKVFDVIQKAAISDAPVIIYGESGTGKDLVANAIHTLGRRSHKPFVQFNCAALNESLLESELFGHIKGAFTGAIQHKIGRFEAADGGDIFLDEIGDVPMAIQVKLLRVLETKQFERVGDHRPLSVDVRVITATNKNLEELIAQNRFRDDLFFRINVIPIYLAPLRERTEDIPSLVNEFISRLNRRSGKSISGLSRHAMDRFLSYHWPGNVRELKSALEYAFVVADSNLIGEEHLPRQVTEQSTAKAPEPLLNDNGGPTEKSALIAALRQSGGNQSQAARILGINRVTVWNRMKKYGIDLKKVMTT